MVLENAEINMLGLFWCWCHTDQTSGITESANLIGKI